MRRHCCRVVGKAGLVIGLAGLALLSGCRKKQAEPRWNDFPDSNVYVLEDSKWRASYDKEANCILLVSNQSSHVDPVDIKVSMDGAVAVDKNFSVDGKFPQPNWKRFKFWLPRGTHKLSVTSVKGKATLEKEFEIKEKHWAALTYWRPSVLGFRIADTELVPL